MEINSPNEKSIEDLLNQLWAKEEYVKFTTAPFLYPTEIKKGAMLFIGINPSVFEEQKNQTSYVITNENISHEYFRKMVMVAEATDNKENWTHLDLLFMRETKQKEIPKMFKSKEGIKFIWDQLTISSKMIRDANPKILIVSNALAATFLGKNYDPLTKKNEWLNFKFQFDKGLGTHVWEGKPVFFTSMLSGQRALDLGSLERLIWHIKMVLDGNLKSTINKQ